MRKMREDNKADLNKPLIDYRLSSTLKSKITFIFILQ